MFFAPPSHFGGCSQGVLRSKNVCHLGTGHVFCQQAQIVYAWFLLLFAQCNGPIVLYTELWGGRFDTGFSGELVWKWWGGCHDFEGSRRLPGGGCHTNGGDFLKLSRVNHPPDSVLGGSKRGGSPPFSWHFMPFSCIFCLRRPAGTAPWACDLELKSDEKPWFFVFLTRLMGNLAC